MLLTLRGTPVLYYGDELGMPETELADDDRLDPAGETDPPGRDGARTPMHWSGEPGAGFTEPGVRPWLPFGRHGKVNVEAQRDEPGSVLSFVREALALRREEPDLWGGSYAPVETKGGLWAWRRGERTIVAVNLSDEPASIDGVEGRIRLATAREREGDEVAGRLEVGPWEGVVV
jgi:alpha-glucosidase